MNLADPSTSFARYSGNPVAGRRPTIDDDASARSDGSDKAPRRPPYAHTYPKGGRGKESRQSESAKWVAPPEGRPSTSRSWLKKGLDTLRMAYTEALCYSAMAKADGEIRMDVPSLAAVSDCRWRKLARRRKPDRAPQFRISMRSIHPFLSADGERRDPHWLPVWQLRWARFVSSTLRAPAWAPQQVSIPMVRTEAPKICADHSGKPESSPAAAVTRPRAPWRMAMVATRCLPRAKTLARWL